MMLARNKIIGSFALLVATLALVNACNYTTPEALNPTPGLENNQCVSQNGTASCRKSFFGVEIDHEKNEWSYDDKTWLCGWAPTSQGGKWKNALGMSATPYRSRHCNIKFKISADGSQLEAREIDLDLSAETSENLLFTIPITMHYFYEKERDSRGREMNRFSKVRRKNWEISPFMDLNLKGIRFHNQSKSPYGYIGQNIVSSFDMEASVGEDGKRFFGFTTTQTALWYGSLIQHDMRYNFLEIKPNKNFVKTPYHNDNALHMNILHILGHRPNGFDEINYAAHWDFSKPIEMCINNFPEGGTRDYYQVALDVLEEMNAGLRAAKIIGKNQKGFIPSTKKYKYNYDLRCPSITWVDDPNLSLRAPLGIGLVNTNVATGEILWGGAVIWGGLIDYIVNRDRASATDALASGTFTELSEASIKENPYFVDIGSKYPFKSWHNGFGNLEDVVQIKGDKTVRAAIKEALPNRNETLRKMPKATADDRERVAFMKQAITDLQAYVLSDKFKDPEASGDGWKSDSLYDAIKEEKNPMAADYVDLENYVERLEDYSQLNASIDYEEEERVEKKLMNGTISEKDFTLLAHKKFKEFSFAGAYDLDNTIQNHYDGWLSTIDRLDRLEKPAAARSVVKNVMLHELGHVVGLGHQFEGNRMPLKGTVPDHIYNTLSAESQEMQNYTSIMDYMSGHTEVALPYNKVKIQIQDVLTLRYLYKQQYSTFKAGAPDFEFDDVPPSGIIPGTHSKDKNYKTTYMPQCSDTDAWVADSPYCRRWDRGYNARTMVEENFSQYTDSFLTKTNAFSDARGGNPWIADYNLWSRTNSMVNSNRTFYDRMRFLMLNNPTYKRVFNKFKHDETDALYEFSRSCVDPTLAPDKYSEDFAKLTLVPTVEKTGTLSLTERQKSATYNSLLATFKSAKKGRNIYNMNAHDFDLFKDELYSQGVELTELHDLCHATKISLDQLAILLDLQGPDHTMIDYSRQIRPTGLRGGNATYDYSKTFGKYDQLGLLNLKIAAIDSLTSPASTMRWGWFRVPKPIYNDPNSGKYSYFSLYPKEFTEIVSVSVRNNMGFADDKINQRVALSVLNLYMPFFLFRTFNNTNDKLGGFGFNDNYIQKIMLQSNFDFSVDPVLLKGITNTELNLPKRYGFRPQLISLADRELYDLIDAYVLPERDVIIRGNPNQIILPITKMRWLSAENAYVWAINIQWDPAKYDDRLQGASVRNDIDELAKQELARCIDGFKGLSAFFTLKGFDGFDVVDTIAQDSEAQTKFDASVDREFGIYQDRLNPEQKYCSSSNNGIGLITATAMSLNGYILPQTFKYITTR